MTHRGLSSAFVVVSGHAESAWRPVLEALPARGVTIVVLMGLHLRAALAAFLLGRGFSHATPAAVLLGAGTREAWTWRGRLDEIPTVTLPDASADAPGTIVIGEVVSIAAALSDDELARVSPRAEARAR